MARQVEPNTKYRIKPHCTKGSTYASTQPPCIDPETGKKKYRYIHWGRVDDELKFMPSSSFFLATPEERAKHIFPLLREAQHNVGYGKLNVMESMA
jgi:hypothetical protein